MTHSNAQQRTDYCNDYLQQGYLVVENVLSTSDIETIISEATSIASHVSSLDKTRLPLDAYATSDTLENQILCIHQPHHRNAFMQKFARHPGISIYLEQLVGAHLAFGTPNVKCMQSMLFFKPAGFPGQAWHQDECFIPTRDRSLTGVWLALDDATVENGCLRVIPGSHRNGVLYDQREPSLTDEFDGTQESFGFDESHEVAVEVRAGSAIFFNGYLLHRSMSNRSDSPRRSLVFHYMSAESYLPWATQDSSVATRDNRQILLISGTDPYAHRGVVEGNDLHVRAVSRT